MSLDPQDVVKALADTIAETVRENKVRHPEDILVHAFTVTEAVYEFVSRLPRGTFNL